MVCSINGTLNGTSLGRNLSYDVKIVKIQCVLGVINSGFQCRSRALNTQHRSFPFGDLNHHLIEFFWPNRFIPKRHLNKFNRFLGLKNLTNRHGDRQTHSPPPCYCVCSNRLLLLTNTTIRPKMGHVNLTTSIRGYYAILTPTFDMA